MKKEEIILNTDDSAATLVTVTGWRSSTGRFFGDSESSARYDGSTHITCECGNVTSKSYTKCESCREKKSIENYNKLEFKEWDHETPLYDDVSGSYFMDSDELEEFIYELEQEWGEELEPGDLRLLICYPNNYHNICSDYWSDILPTDDDADIPSELKAKLDELNKFLDTLEPASWSPSKIRTEYKIKKND